MQRLARVPRSWLITAVAVAGMIGLLFGKQNHWQPIESFLYTVLLALGCILVTVRIYNSTHPDKPNTMPIAENPKRGYTNKSDKQSVAKSKRPTSSGKQP